MSDQMDGEHPMTLTPEEEKEAKEANDAALARELRVVHAVEWLIDIKPLPRESLPDLSSELATLVEYNNEQRAFLQDAFGEISLSQVTDQFRAAGKELECQLDKFLVTFLRSNRTVLANLLLHRVPTAFEHAWYAQRPAAERFFYRQKSVKDLLTMLLSPDWKTAVLELTRRSREAGMQPFQLYVWAVERFDEEERRANRRDRPGDNAEGGQ